jgi:hypothetical protein
MLTFSAYLTDRRYLTSSLSKDGWIFVIFALGDARYLRVQCWSELKSLIQEDNLSPQLHRGAYRVWKSYTMWRRRKRSVPLQCVA